MIDVLFIFSVEFVGELTGKVTSFREGRTCFHCKHVEKPTNDKRGIRKNQVFIELEPGVMVSAFDCCECEHMLSLEVSCSLRCCFENFYQIRHDQSR